jgi:hypothetical protein
MYLPPNFIGVRYIPSSLKLIPWHWDTQLS